MNTVSSRTLQVQLVCYLAGCGTQIDKSIPQFYIKYITKLSFVLKIT